MSGGSEFTAAELAAAEARLVDATAEREAAERELRDIQDDAVEQYRVIAIAQAALGGIESAEAAAADDFADAVMAEAGARQVLEMIRAAVAEDADAH